MIGSALLNHKKSYPQHKEALLFFDEAGCYSGHTLLARLPYMGAMTGIRIIQHKTGETDGGKGVVDINFGVNKDVAEKQVTFGIGKWGELSKQLEQRYSAEDSHVF